VVQIAQADPTKRLAGRWCGEDKQRAGAQLRSISLAGTVLGVLLAGVPGPTYAQMRFEMRPVETITLSTQQFLTGDKNGKPAIVAGELRIPKPGTDKLPAVILVHGSGGISALQDRWVQELNSIGVATFLLDSFTGRGIFNTANDQSQLDSLAMMVDAYRALGSLAQHPRIDANRISVMGFSKGAVAAVYSSNERFRKMYGPPNVEFAAHIGLYTPCNTTYRDDTKVTGKPMRLFHGMADDWVPIEPCRAYVARLKQFGADVVLAEYAGAYHAYDAYMLKEPMIFPQAQTARHCLLAEGDGGEVLNSKTAKRFDLNDPCVERGTTVAYNEEATSASTKAVKEFLTTLPPGAMTKH
jgi:dienelactone hydrolase